MNAARCRWPALVAADTVAVARLLRNMSARLIRRESNTLEYAIMLAPSGERHHSRGCSAFEMTGPLIAQRGSPPY